MRSLPLAAVPILALSTSPARAEPPPSALLSKAERGALIASLSEASLRPSWVGVHAAEALLVMSVPDPALNAFAPQAASVEPRYRIGVWRVLARAHRDPSRRSEYVTRIRNTLLDETAPDRLHALEALAKLGEPLAGDEERRGVASLLARDPAAAPFALWRSAIASDADAVPALLACLKSTNPASRARAAYVLARLPAAREKAMPAIAEALSREPSDTPAYPALASAEGGETLRELALQGATAGARYTAAMGLADVGTPADRPILDVLLKDADEDVRVAAAFALLSIDGRRSAPTTRPAD